MGYHQLHTPKKMVSTNPCDFCGGDAALCRSWLDRGGGTTIKTRSPSACCLLSSCLGSPVKGDRTAQDRIRTASSGHLAKKGLSSKGCAWLGQERQQAPYAPRHWALKTGCRWDRWAGRTRLPSPRRARISASAWIPGWDRKRTGSCNCRLQMHSAGTCDLSLTRAQKGRMHIDCSHVLDAVGVFNWSEIADGYKIQLRGCKCHVWSVG